MSVAFDRAMDEIKRVWEASDHFESKVLQFIGIISAGALAAAAILANKVHPLLTPYPSLTITLFVAGGAALLGFILVALLSAIGIAFSGPLDPRLLANNPHYLRDDDEFEEDMLPFIAQAFDQCLNGQERKWRLFRWSLVALLLSVLCLGTAFGFCALAPTKPQPSTAGVEAMSDKNPQPSGNVPKQPVQPLKPGKPDAGKPVLGPYTVTKGMTIPNEPKGGTFPRDSGGGAGKKK
jgi:hypothetical protein